MTDRHQIVDLAKDTKSHQPRIHAFYMTVALEQLMDESGEEPLIEELLRRAEKLTREHPQHVPLPSLEECLAGNPRFGRVEELSAEEKRELNPLPLVRKSSFERYLDREMPMLSESQPVCKVPIMLPESKPVSHKPFCSPDFLKEARRAQRKARMAVRRLKDAKNEAERETVSTKPPSDPYAAVKAKKIQEEQEERKFQVQNPHNGLATRVRVTSTKKPNKKRRRR